MSETNVPIETLLAHAEWVRALARRLVRDDATADDLVQETWLTAIRRPPAPGSARGWLGTVLRNVWRQRARAGERRTRHESAAPIRPPVEESGTIVARADAHRRVVDAVMALDEPYRTTVLMRFFDGLAPGEIAARSGVPVETVRTRTRRALERLRGDLARCEGGDDRAWRAALLPLLAVDRGAPAGAAAVGTTGVLAMGVATKIAWTTAAVIALGGALWWTTQDGADAPAARGENVVETAGTPEVEADAARRRVRAPDPAEVPGAAPDVDLAAGKGPKLAPTTRVVRVEDATGAPAAGALVILFSGDTVLAEARTADDGSAAADIAPGAVTALILADDHPALVVELADDTETRAVLPRGAVIEGLVRVDGGAPEDGLRLDYRPDQPIGRYGDVTPGVRTRLRELRRDAQRISVRVDSDGRFRVASLPDTGGGRLGLPKGYDIADRRALRIDGPRNDVLLELTRLAMVVGRIVDGDGEASPRARAEVTYEDENGVVVNNIRHADELGRFAVALPTRRAQGVVLAVANRDGRGERVLELGALEPGQRDVGDIALSSIETVTVRVRDPAGQPIQRAVITAKYGTRPVCDPTDAEGHTKLPLSPGETKITVAALGHLPRRRILPPGTSGVVDVGLEPATLLTVHVGGPTSNGLEDGGPTLPSGLAVRVEAEEPVLVDTDGAEGAWVAAGAVGTEARHDYEQPNEAWFLTRAPEPTHVAGLIADRSLRVTLVDAFGVVHGSESVVLRPGEPHAMSFRDLRPATTFRGRVLGGDGKPLPSASVRASTRLPHSNTVSMTGDAEGRFELAGVAAESVDLLVFAERHSMRKIESVPVGQKGDEYTIRMEAAQSVRLRVLDAEGNLVSNAIVSMRLPAEGNSGRLLSRMARRVADGEYDLRDVPLRKIEIRVRVGGTSHPFEIDGAVAETTIRLPAR